MMKNEQNLNKYSGKGYRQKRPKNGGKPQTQAKRNV